MAKKVKRITFDSLVRLVIFGFIVYLAILYINSSRPDKIPTPDTPVNLPPIINLLVDSIASSSAFRELSARYTPKIEEIKKLPQQEYDKFKNQLIDELLTRLDATLRSK